MKAPEEHWKNCMKKSDLPIIALIVLVGFLLFGSALNYPFTYDDSVFFSDSVFVRKISNLGVLFEPSKYFKYSKELTYRPFSVMTYLVGFQLFKVTPFYHRLINLSLHILASILVYFFIKKLLDKKIASLTALLFVALPVHSEDILFITFNDDILITVFCLLAFILYLKGDEKSYNISLLFFLLALLSKEMAFSFPVILIIYDLCFNKKLALRKYLGYFLVAFLFFLIRFFAFVSPLEKGMAWNCISENYFLHILTMLKVFPYYLKIMVFPKMLMLYPLVAPVKSFLETGVIISILVIILYLLLILYFSKNKTVLFALLFVPVSLLPVSNIIPTIQNYVAERYLYFPSIGICLLLSVLFVKLFERTKLAGVFLSVLLFTYSIVILERNLDYRTFEDFWLETLKQRPTHGAGYIGAGCISAMKNQNKEALYYFKKALEFSPGDYTVYWNIANAYLILRETATAEVMFKQISAAHMDDVACNGYCGLSKIYLNQNNLEKGKKYIEKAISLNPYIPEPYKIMGDYFIRNNEILEATGWFKKAFEVDPYNSSACVNYGNYLVETGRYRQGIRTFKRVLVFEKKSAVDVYYNISLTYYKMGKLEKAKKYIKKAIKISPRFKLGKRFLEKLEYESI